VRDLHWDIDWWISIGVAEIPDQVVSLPLTIFSWSVKMRRSVRIMQLWIWYTMRTRTHARVTYALLRLLRLQMHVITLARMLKTRTMMEMRTIMSCQRPPNRDFKKLPVEAAAEAAVFRAPPVFEAAASSDCALIHGELNWIRIFRFLRWEIKMGGTFKQSNKTWLTVATSLGQD